MHSVHIADHDGSNQGNVIHIGDIHLFLALEYSLMCFINLEGTYPLYFDWLVIRASHPDVERCTVAECLEEPRWLHQNWSTVSVA